MHRYLFYKIIFCFLFFNSCNENENIKNSLQLKSEKYFTKKEIDISTYNSVYYIRKGDSYIHNVLKYYKVVGQDSLIIYFSMDDTGESFIDITDEFYNYNKSSYNR